jgi:vacuolar-type H+-ATPase subunit H
MTKIKEKTTVIIFSGFWYNGAMERDLLSRLVEAEREIMAKIESEKKKCDDRLEDARRKTEEMISREKALIQEENERSFQEAEKNARERASKILDTYAQRTARLRGLSDEALQKIVVNYTNRILPEEHH